MNFLSAINFAIKWSPNCLQRTKCLQITKKLFAYWMYPFRQGYFKKIKIKSGTLHLFFMSFKKYSNCCGLIIWCILSIMITGNTMKKVQDILYLILKLNVFTGVISLMAGKFLPVPCKRRRKRQRIWKQIPYNFIC